MEVYEPFIIEKILKKKFNEICKLVAGSEYFEGDEIIMLKHFTNCIINYKCDTTNGNKTFYFQYVIDKNYELVHFNYVNDKKQCVISIDLKNEDKHLKIFINALIDNNVVSDDKIYDLSNHEFIKKILKYKFHIVYDIDANKFVNVPNKYDFPNINNICQKVKETSETQELIKFYLQTNAILDNGTLCNFIDGSVYF